MIKLKVGFIQMVKSEIFGTRKSILKEKIASIKDIEIIEKIWFCTCIYKYNKNPETRYLFLFECSNEEEFLNKKIDFLKNFIKRKGSLLKTFINKGKIKFFDELSKEIKEFPYDIDTNNELAAKYLLSKVDCLCGELIPAKTSIIDDPNISELSKFLRKDLFGRMATSDLDFIILKDDSLILIEEKLYLEEDNDGSIGKGQFSSFKEILKDVLNLDKNIKWYILFHNKNKELFCYNFLDERKNIIHKEKKDLIRKEIRIIIDKKDLEKVNFLELIKND